jgi:hypothetical protein
MMLHEALEAVETRYDYNFTTHLLNNSETPNPLAQSSSAPNLGRQPRPPHLNGTGDRADDSVNDSTLY